MTPALAPAPPGRSPSPEGGIERGVGGPHAPHPQPRPIGGERAGRLESPSQSAPGRRNLLQAPGPGVQGPLPGQGPGRRGPQRRGRGLSRGRSCKQPQRPGLASKSPASQAPPRAAPAHSPPRGRRAPGPGHRRVVGSPPRRAPGARGAAPGAEKGEVRTYLSLLSTPSWIHLSTSPQSIMASRGLLLPAGYVIRDPLDGDPSPRNVAPGSADPASERPGCGL
ncbi:basic proline-rich protein-like [Cebus imitator]|uniref:basic proline-rich protein-like n=1 Tax=Cebus imitator TaxID=2715852 RepID=UPI000809BF1F|nr:basic proline-rich protein-like [Cebus imitator]